MVVPMSRTMLTRIAKLEARTGGGGGASSHHVIWAYSDMDAQQQKAAMVAAGKANEGDNFIVVSFVAPSGRAEPEGWSR
jgi:hypothetical protein